MAKRRRKSKKTIGRRKRRMSGIGGNIDMMSIIGVIAGAFGGKMLNKVIPDSVNKKIVSGGKIVLGIALPMFIKGKSQNIMKGVGNGLIAVGTIEMLTDLGIMSGLGFDNDETLSVDLSGIEDVRFEDLDGEISANVLSANDVPVINADVLSADDVPVINGEYYE